MRVRLAPSWLAATYRSLVFLGAAVLVGGIMYATNGPPTLTRKSRFDEFVVFAPRLGRGITELATETFVLIGLTWVFRGGLKIRLEAKPPYTPTRFE
jgi:hypothetical protein